MNSHTGEDFISQYLKYIGDTEAPMIYHRWCCLSMIGAFLERQYTFKFGHFDLYTNLYVMLIGVAGTRKSTAIRIAKKIITTAGYDRISADRSSKEKFLLDLSGEDTDLLEGTEGKLDNILDRNLWGVGDSKVSEMYIACDEFNDFIGINNVEFLSILGTFWDYAEDKPYTNRIKTGKSIAIYNPTVSILGGNTPVSFARAFPPEIIDQGFFSRLLLIQSEPTGKKITFPERPSVEYTSEIAKELIRIKTSIKGQADTDKKSRLLLDKIYKNWVKIDDARFESYGQRRLSHLLKLCLIVSAARYSDIIREEDIIYANTILSYAENFMPKAMGQFGRSRNSDVAHRIMQVLDNAMHAMTIKDIWKYVHSDLEKVGDLSEIIRSLYTADKLIMTKEGGILSKKKMMQDGKDDMIDYSLLTTEERGMIL